MLEGLLSYEKAKVLSSRRGQIAKTSGKKGALVKLSTPRGKLKGKSDMKGFEKDVQEIRKLRKL
jgi:hypothetical protein